MTTTDVIAFDASDGARLRAYEWRPAAAGPPVVLLHGYTSFAHETWVVSGAKAGLDAAGRRVIALDFRGHGGSARLYDPEAYASRRMVADVIELVDRLGLQRYELAGYSLGGVLGALVAAHDPRVLRFALCGCVQQILRQSAPPALAPTVAAGLRAGPAGAVTDPFAAFFRQTALDRGADLDAMAACIEGLESSATPDWGALLSAVTAPTLLLGGRQDPWMTGAETLAAMIPGASISWTEGDHLQAFRTPAFASALAAFMVG